VQTGLDRKEKEERELVQPVQVVGDDDVVAGVRKVFATFDPEPKGEPEQRDAEEPDQAIGHVRAGADWDEIRSR
jgi:hypothetical protein